LRKLLETGGIWAYSGQTTPLNLMADFEKIRKHISQWDNPDRSRDDLHREGPENLSSLYAHLAVERWLWAGALPFAPTGPGAIVFSL
jgi:hypothetical protein